MEVAGVDGCHEGWLVVRADTAEDCFALREPRVVADFAALLDATKACAAVAVDIPIGLADSGPRLADGEARRLLERPRASSVFPTPVRAVLGARDYRSACDASFAACGKCISQQTFNILAKIREVDAAMTPSLQERVVEGHPEVSFRALGGRPMCFNKKRPAGRAERRALLVGVFDAALPERSPAGAALDDLNDACVLAWTAARVVSGQAQRLPPAPQHDGRGLRMEIVY